MRPHRFVSLFTLVLITACSDRSTSGGGDTGGTIVMAQPGTGSSPMIPPLADDIVARTVSDNVYERLAEIGMQLNTVGDRGFVPRLAASWQWAPDSMSIAFAIDPRARWHDGRPVTAGDVRFTLGLLKDPKTASSLTSLLGNVDSVSVRDSLTAVVWFHKRTPEQFYDFTYQVFVLPEHIFKDIARDKLGTSEAAMRPVGSGQFRFARFEPGVRVELVADTAHYRGRPKLDRVIIAFVSDPNAAITQLFSGQADFLEFIPPGAWSSVDSNAALRRVPYPALQYIYLGMNQRDPKRLNVPHPIFGDRLVRHAISMALDRQAMLRNVYDTLGVLGSGPSPRVLGDTTVVLPPFDRARAAALLDSAGWRAGPDGQRMKNGRPLAFSVLVPTSSAPRMRYAVLIQEQLRGMGVRAEIESMDVNAFQERMRTGAFDAVLNGTATDPTPTGAKQAWTEAGFHPRGQNWLRYSNPTVSALLDSLAGSFDPARSDDYLHRAIETLVDDAPAVWLYDVVTMAGVHKRIRPGPFRADAWWANLSEWSIPANERIERDRIGLRPAQP